MDGEREECYPRYEDRVRQEANADPAQLQVAANYPDDHSEEERMNDDRAGSGRHADQQGIQKRDLIRRSH